MEISMQFNSVTVVTKKHKEVVLRMAKTEEAQALIDSMVEISETSPYILMSAENFKNTKLDDEIKWIESYNADPRALLIVAQKEDQIVGILDFKAFKNPKIRHRGLLGISLHHTVRGEGLGELLFKKLITEAKKIDDLTMIELSVMADNHQAFHLYKKVGFVEVGRKPKAYKQPDGQFCDEIQMVLALAEANVILFGT